MKYVNMLIIFFALLWTYHSSREGAPVSTQMHQMIQMELSNLISNYVATHLPDSPKVHFRKMWTEFVAPHSVRANFEYSFESSGNDNDLAKTELTGSAMLTPDKQKAPGEAWVLESIKILNESIEYKDGLVIMPDKKTGHP